MAIIASILQKRQTAVTAPLESERMRLFGFERKSKTNNCYNRLFKKLLLFDLALLSR